MTLRHKILVSSGLAVLVLSALVCAAIIGAVRSSFAQAETSASQQNARRVRTTLVQMGLARSAAKKTPGKSTLVLRRNLTPANLAQIGQRAGGKLSQRLVNASLPADWVAARAQLQKSEVATFAKPTAMSAWTSVQSTNGKDTVLLRLDSPYVMRDFARRILVALAGGLFLGGLLLGTSTMLVIDRLVLRRLQAHLQDAADADGSLALAGTAQSEAQIRTELELARRSQHENEEMFRQMAV
ncbi:MAG TPA: hypothetical protein VF719_00870, partial [Abditibacteriaceae bacterium]